MSVMTAVYNKQRSGKLGRSRKPSVWADWAKGPERGGKTALQVEGKYTVQPMVPDSKMFCYLFCFCTFLWLTLTKRTCRFPKSKKKQKRKTKKTVAFCVYIVSFLQIYSLILWFKAEMKNTMIFLKKTHQISGYHKTLLYYYTAHYLLYVIDV